MKRTGMVCCDGYIGLIGEGLTGCWFLAACVLAEVGDGRAEQQFWPSQIGFSSKSLSSVGPVS